MTVAISDGRPASSLEIRATTVGDVAYIAETWHRSVLRDSRRARAAMAIDRAVRGHTVIDQLLAREDVFTLAAYDDTRERPIVGWMAWSPGRIPAVHYVYIRHGDRGQGVAMLLLRSPIAELGNRMVYTFKGMRGGSGETLDTAMVAALERRGAGVLHVPIREWMRSLP